MAQSILQILIEAVTSQAQTNLTKLNDTLKNTGTTSAASNTNLKNLGISLAKAVIPAVTAGIAIKKLGDFLQFSIQEATEAEVVQAKLNAVLIATEGAAGISADAVNRLADRLSFLSGVDDEAIVSAETLMLTYTAIGKDVFPRAMEAALDLSTVLGTDLSSSVKLLGKVLSDPVELMGSLSRAGVVLTDTQKDLVKSLWEAGKEAEAQAIILEALESKYEGAAKAAGETYAGQVAKLQNAWSNFAESVGSKIIPTLTDLLELLTGFNRTMDLVNEVTQRTDLSMFDIAEAFRDAGFGASDYTEKIDYLEKILADLPDKTDLAANSILGVGDASSTAGVGVDGLALGMDGLSTSLEESKVKFDDWALGIETGMSSAVASAIEDLEWLMAGGLELQKTFENVSWALTNNAITPEQGEAFFKQIFVQMTALQLELDQITADQAAQNIASALGIAVETAKALLGQITAEPVGINFEIVDPTPDQLQDWLSAAKPTPEMAKELFDPLIAGAESAGAALSTSIAEAAGTINTDLAAAIGTATTSLEELAQPWEFDATMTANDAYIDETQRKIDTLTTTRVFNVTMFINESYIRQMLALVEALAKDRTFTITAKYQTSGSIPGGQHGLSMKVPPGYSNDSFLFGATSGEQVTITPASVVEGVGSGYNKKDGGRSVIVNFNAPVLGFSDEYELARKLKPIIERAMR